MRFVKAFGLAVFAILGSAVVSAQEITPPSFSGVIRGRWEMMTESGLDAFSIRNAEVKLSGAIGDRIEYVVNTDFCNQGKIVFQDGYARLKLMQELKLRAGKFQIPFGFDADRGPGSYIFSNEAFMSDYIGYLRTLGVQFEYRSSSIPLVFEVGAFSSNENDSYNKVANDMIGAARLWYTFGDFNVMAAFASMYPETVRVNMSNAAVNFHRGRWMLEAEYMYKHYVNSAFDACHSYNFFANYAMPIKAWQFNQLSFQGRFDGATDHSSGVRNDEGNLCADQPSRSRITLGSTVSYLCNDLRCDFRINFEKFFYSSDNMPNTDRLSAELVFVF